MFAVGAAPELRIYAKEKIGKDLSGKCRSTGGERRGKKISSPPSLCTTAFSFICTYTQYKSHIANFLKKTLQRILAGIKETVVKVKKKKKEKHLNVHKSVINKVER